MADRIKLRRGPKNNIDLNVYELGYATDSDEERLYFNNGSMVPIPNNKDITDIKTELTETTNVSNKNKQDVSELKESIAGIIKTGVAKLVQYSYDIELSENTKKVNIPYERYSSVTDTLKVYVNGLAIQNDQYTITDPVENEGIVTNGYIVLKVERPAGTIVRIEVWKNVPSGEEGEVSGNIITKNSLPLDRIIGINDITSNISQLSNPNLLINGDFQLWQRGTSFNFTDGINYTADRWNHNYQIASYSRVNNTSQAPCKYAIRVVNNATNNEGYAILKQPFEETLMNSIKGKEVTLSFYVRGQSSVRLNANIGKNISLDYPEFNIELTSEWKRVSKVLCSNECNNLTIQLRGAEGSSKDDWFEVTGVKLELGSVATPFIPRQYSEELDLCLRYYCRSKISQNLIASDDKQIMVNINTPKIMRINPTATYDSDIYFHNLSDGNTFKIGNKGDHPHSIDEYFDDCNIKLWICNSNESTQITSGMFGVINSANNNNNNLSASAIIIFDAEIY